MSVHEEKGFVRCWTCKSNGINRIFRGNEERQLHEKSMHASLNQFDNHMEKSKSFDSVSEASSNFGSLSNDFRQKTSQLKSCFAQSKKYNQRVRQDIKAAICNPLIKAEVGGNDRWLRSYEMEEHSSTKSVIEKLGDDDIDMALVLSNGREAMLEDQLYVLQRELDNTNQHLSNVKGAVDAERLKHSKTKKGFENRLRYQKMYIIKLRRKLQSEKMALKEIQSIEITVEDLRKQLSCCKTELASTKMVNMDTNREKEKLVIENEDMKKRLKRFQHDFAKLASEHNDLVKKHNARNESEVFQSKLLEAEEFYHEKLKEERVNFAESIEEYTRKYENLELKYRDCEGKLEKTLSDLDTARSELMDSEIYRQHDIDKLLREKESLKLELKANNMNVQDLERANKLLKCRLMEKEMRSEECHGANLHAYDEYGNLIVNALLHEEARLAEEQRERVKNFGSQSTSQGIKEMLFYDVENRELERKNFSLEKENSLLEKKNSSLEKILQTLKEEQSIKEADVNAVKSRNGDLEELLTRHEDKIEELQRTVHEMLTEKVSFSREIIELRSNLDSKDEEMSYMRKIVENIEKHRKGRVDANQSEKRSVFEGELKRDKGGFGERCKSREKLEASCKQSGFELKEKINEALKITDETKAKCIELEARLRQDDGFSKHGLETIGKKLSKRVQQNYERGSNYKDLQGGINNFREKSSRMEIDVDSNKELKALANENKGLRKALGSRESLISLNSDRINEEFRVLHDALEKMRQRERKIQRHNYGLRKRLEEEEIMRNMMNEQMTSVSRCLERHRIRKVWGDSDTENLVQEVKKWQETFDNMLKTNQKTESKIEIISKRSLEMVEKLEMESKTLQKKVDNAKFEIKEKQNELTLLKKSNGDFYEFSAIVETRNEEIKAKNKQIEDIDERNRKLVADKNLMEGMLRELEEKLETLESERDELLEEKRITQLQKACDNKNALKFEEKKSTSRVDGEMEKVIDEDDGMEKVPQRESCKPEEKVLKCDYENDFHSCSEDEFDEDGDNGGNHKSHEEQGESLVSGEDGVIDECQLEQKKSEASWDIVTSEKSWQDLSLSDKSGLGRKRNGTISYGEGTKEFKNASDNIGNVVDESKFGEKQSGTVNEDWLSNSCSFERIMSTNIFE